ncbi:MAG: RluA family pseudouridine synthase [Peptococcaceae bacterium]|jgi:23S rRNA pseudouridine1911/1915/1917 synthase|nr:RluA family pseudouridine synthase [Peptococcaceae bacterium]MBQ2036136.1 RluA family pseudouridine synthase [Peptococcaceae bacterium]MBQ2449309.1 RluA family pseudouridine synthase [Peptococcaceae bacterium]MBQ5652131.1 RluA family pseudouridine synthase [Peptococcaceae bacterium]MBQ5682342.1 RluA family pseudouridine synthase [Peptococcaceae bacterium]
MDIFELEITAEENGTRLDSYLAEELEGISRSYLQKLIGEGLILVNQKTVKANYKVKTGDTLLVQIPEAAPVDIQPEPMDLDIVYEDSDLLIVNKPVGLVVHPAHGHYSGTLVNGLLAHCTDLSGINGKMRPGIVHRIDKDTSGLLMIAKNDLAHQHLAEQLKAHSIKRAYYALVQGVISEPAGLVDAPIGRHEIDRKKMAVTFKNSKEARTHYYVKERFAKNTFIECRLETGRTHQIRVHMAYLGHPLVGDPLYGTRKNNLDFPGQALHAYALGFVHPRTGEELYFEAPIPEHFQSVLKTLAQGN